MEKQQDDLYKKSGLAGIFIHLQQPDRFESRRLTEVAQVLALQVVDLNLDSIPDILAGNDFDSPDAVWLGGPTGWTESALFTKTPFSTMSFAVGDLNNDRMEDLFATDMRPYSSEPEIMNQWQPLLDTMIDFDVEGDPQAMENVLQVRSEKDGFADVAESAGLAASGWSAAFGDLDQDGLLDLYVVNGMAALEIFSHLPNDELVEENQVYRNLGNGSFAPQPLWGLNSRLGGRSMAMADFDDDGDLDIVVNNLRARSQLFENQLCEGESLQVTLRDEQSANTFAIGAKLVLATSIGDLTRTVRASGGYLSGQSAHVHFGFPEGTALYQLEIVWPDGVRTDVAVPTTNIHMQVTRLISTVEK